MGRRPWSQEEGEKLIDAVSKADENATWDDIAKMAKLERDGKSCSGRWMNYLRPGLNKEAFTEDEDETIVKLQEFCKNRWAQIATFLPGRSAASVKTRWNNYLKASTSFSRPVNEENVGSVMAEFASVMEPES